MDKAKIFHNGDKVKIDCRDINYSKLWNIEELMGVVSSKGDPNRYSTVPILIDGIINTGSTTGVFYINKTKITKINNLKEPKMLKSKYTVSIRFLDGIIPNKRFALYEDEIEVDDFVVVNTAHHGMALATIIEKIDGNIEQAINDRQVICKVDTTNFYKREELIKRKAQLQKELKTYIAKVNEQLMYETLITHFPECESIVNELKDIDLIK